MSARRWSGEWSGPTISWADVDVDVPLDGDPTILVDPADLVRPRRQLYEPADRTAPYVAPRRRR